MNFRTFLLTALVTCSLTTATRAANIYTIDINDADNSLTEAGWTGLDANHTGNGGAVIVDSVSFAPFSADGARLRGTTTSPSPDALVGDFVFDDGAGQAVGLSFGGAGDLQAGDWQVEVWIWDADYTGSGSLTSFVGWRANGTETIVANDVESLATGPAITFNFTSDGTAAYDVFVRENNAGNRTRLNAVRLTLVPEPTVGLLAAFCALPFFFRRKR
jgi:hypothetical protein